MIEGYLIWKIQTKRRGNIANHRVYRNILLRISVFSLYRICAFAMLFAALLDPNFVLFFFDRLRGPAELVQATGPLVAFLILSTRSDVLRAWRLKNQQSSIQAMQDVDRERVFQITPRAIPLESEMLEDNRGSDETQITSESPHVSLPVPEEEKIPYNRPSPDSNLVTCLGPQRLKENRRDESQVPIKSPHVFPPVPEQEQNTYNDNTSPESTLVNRLPIR